MLHTTSLFLRIADLEHPSGSLYRASWHCYDPQGNVIAHASTPQPLNEIAQTLPATAKKIIVLLPGQSVLLTTTPAGKHAQDFQKTPKAAAYAVEDQLAESAEEVHSAVGPTDKAEVVVAIIHDNWMRKLMHELADANLYPDVITSEAMLLPSENGKAILLVEGNEVLFRFSETVASKLEQELFLAFTDTCLTQAHIPAASSLPALHTLELWTSDDISAEFMQALQAICQSHDISIRFEHVPNSFDWLCQYWIASAYDTKPINLLQGPYQHRDTHTTIPDLKSLAAVAAIWFVLQMAFDAGSAYYFNSQADQLRAQSETIYHRLFPADTRIVDVKTQFTQHLNPAGNNDGNFIPLLSVLASGMAAANHPDIEQLQYDTGKNELSADILANDFVSLDAFKHLDADVDIGSAAKEDKGVRAQVRIRGRSGKDQHG